MEVKDLLSEFESLKSDRRETEETWKEIGEWVVPNRGGFDGLSERQRGERRGQKIYDGSSLSALRLYASGLMGQLFGAYDWFSLQTPVERLMDVRSVRLWLSYVDDVLQTMINRSHFYREMFKLFYDGGSMGTATLFRYYNMAEGREVFNVVHPREIYLEENDDGLVDTVFRYFSMSNAQIVKRFQDGNVHQDIQDDAEKSDSRHNRRQMLHIVKPNENYDPRKQDSKARRYASWYVDVEHEQEIRQRGFEVMPYASWRVGKESDEVYGRGPGWDALADIKRLQSMARDDMEASQMRLQPPLDIPDERRGKVHYYPGGKSYYDDLGREVRTLGQPPDVIPTIDKEERLEKIIRQHFMVDYFLTYSDADIGATATEIRDRRQEKAVLQGPQVIGVYQDVFDAVVDGLFNDAWNAGMIPPPPEELMQSLEGRRLEVDYQGPLVQQQRSFFQGEPYRQAVGQWQALTEIMVGAGRSPDFLDNYNMDYVSREMFKSGGGPEEAMLDERVVAEIRKRRAEEQQRQKQLAAMEQMGKATPGLNQPVEEGSPLQAMAEAAGG